MHSHLDDLGVRHTSDLSSLGRDYVRSWERVLAPLRDQSFDLLQIGVGTGASLRVWREAFPEARLIGLDPRRIVLDPEIAKCTIVHGNQTDPGALQPLLRDYRFRLIVDDGSHDPHDQVQTFQLLFPWLEPDSVYICTGFDERAVAAHERSPTIPSSPAPPAPRVPGPSERGEGSRMTDFWAQPAVEVRNQGERREESPRVSSEGLERSEEQAVPARCLERRSEQPPGASWFAELGRELAASEIRDRYPVEQPTREFIRRKTTGVLLLPGCAIVTS